MPQSDAASEAGSAWTVDRDAFNAQDAGRDSAIAEMRERLQAALLSKRMEVVRQTLLDAIDLDAEELEEAMLEVQAYLDRKETKGAVVPRFITDTSLQPIGPMPISNGSLCNWNGTLVRRRDNRFVLDGYSKRLSPHVVRSHIRRRAPQLAKPHGSAGEHEQSMRRAQMSMMQAEIEKLQHADRRVKDLERLRETSGTMAPPQVVDMWHNTRAGPPRSKHRAKTEQDVGIYAPDAWLTPPPSPKASRPATAKSRHSFKSEPEPEPELLQGPEPEPEPLTQSQSDTNLVIDVSPQLDLQSKSPATRQSAAFCRQLSMDVNNTNAYSEDTKPRKAGAGSSVLPPPSGLDVVGQNDSEGFILGMSDLRGGAQKVLEKGLGQGQG